MKFIQTGDIHIGECRTLQDYLQRHRQILEQILDVALMRRIPLIVSGDIFHSKTTNFEERFLFEWWISELEKNKIDTIITTGNHDHIAGEQTQLSGYSLLPFKHVNIISYHPAIRIIEETFYICIPWCNYKTEEIKKIVQRFLPLNFSKYVVVLLHECIAGVRLDSGHVIPTGTAIPDVPEVTYWGIGDIHNHQRTNVPNSFYAGAPAQFKFDDKLPKGIIVIDLENPTEVDEFININVKPLITVNKIDEIKEDAYYKVKGNFEEVLKANQNAQVVKSELLEEKIEKVEKVDSSGEEIKENNNLMDASDLQQFETEHSILEGLPEYLSIKGLDNY
jgi:DNA repair exonuclease SbcCD nuclease subunit